MPMFAAWAPKDHGQRKGTTTGRMGVRLRLGFAFSDPGRHLVVAVRNVILGDVVGGGVPDTVVTENIAQSLVEMLRGIRTPDIVRMKRKAHHAPVFRAFSIERV